MKQKKTADNMADKLIINSRRRFRQQNEDQIWWELNVTPISCHAFSSFTERFRKDLFQLKRNTNQ